MARLVWLAAIVFAMSGCAAWRSSGPAIPADRPPVAVHLDGAALADAGARSAAIAAIGRVTQRRVELVDAAATEAMLTALATRTKRSRAAARAERRRCARHLDAVEAARVGAEGVYRLTLAPATRVATEGGILDVFRTTETPVTGDVTVRVVDGSGKRPRAAVDGSDLASAVAGGIGRLPGLPPARWDAVANGLLKAGCPLMALAVSESRLGDGRVGRGIRTRALAAMEQGGPRPAAPVPAPEAPPEVVATPAPRSEPTHSCETLCSVHIVELCNKDRTLWDRNLAAWERTGCGARRTEAFLLECYRRQRISGAFDEGCVRPCRTAPEARRALFERLQRAGCLRSGPS